jgi:signal transduction histidine kinase
MGWSFLKAFPLRTKVLITLIGAAVMLLGISTHLSFRYWKKEAVATAQQQALLAAASARAAVESALQSGQQDQARRVLRRLMEHAPVRAAVVYGTDGSVLITGNGEPAHTGAIWLPARNDLTANGVARVDASGQVVHAYVPVAVPPASILEVEYGLGALRQAMDRGARLGLALVVGSVLALTAILFTMLEREVVAPIGRVTDLIEPGATNGHTDEVTLLARGVAELIEKEQRVEGVAAEQRRQLEEQAGFAQVGEMAAEMAHEFKRPLASIQSAVRLLSQEYVLEDRGQTLIGAVEDQLDRLSETMRDLFSLARPVGVQAEHVSLREVFDRSTLQLAGHPATNGITIKREFPADDVFVRGDPKRLEQMLLNLMLNAAEAMHEGGELTVRFGAASASAWLTVSDTGCGIPASEVEKVLLPFYSTKPSGTGLGLPLVARVVSAHAGQLHIDSQAGRGTTVRIDLPLDPPFVNEMANRRVG